MIAQQDGRQRKDTDHGEYRQRKITVPPSDRRDKEGDRQIQNGGKSLAGIGDAHGQAALLDEPVGKDLYLGDEGGCGKSHVQQGIHQIKLPKAADRRTDQQRRAAE